MLIDMHLDNYEHDADFLSLESNLKNLIKMNYGLILST